MLRWEQRYVNETEAGGGDGWRLEESSKWLVRQPVARKRQRWCS